MRKAKPAASSMILSIKKGRIIAACLSACVNAVNGLALDAAGSIALKPGVKIPI